MDHRNKKIRQFGDFRLDPEKRVLWHQGEPVNLALKEIDLLCVLTEHSGEVVTKSELLDRVWQDSFVEESNLSRHIYVLRKTFKELGADDALITTVPRRGYRFTAEAREIDPDEIVLEKRTRTRTLIELQGDETRRRSRPGTRSLGIASAVVLIGLISYFAYQFARPSAPGREIRSLAVLPFRSLGENPSHAGAGLADVLTTRLSYLKNVKVRPPVATVNLESSDPVAAGRQLGVDAIIEGTILQVDERVRVTARLIDVGDGSIIWSGDFDKLKIDQLTLQRDIALQIAPMIAFNLSGEERDAIAKKYTENPGAYELYLQGRYEWNKRSTPGMVEAQRLFRNAIVADPQFALAYVGLADVLLTSQPHANEGHSALTTALNIDPTIADAHASMGFFLMFYEWKWDQAEAEFQKAIELNPNYATAHHWYGTLLTIKGDHEGAKAELRKALELNPTSPNFLADLGQAHYFAGEYAEAERLCLQALEAYPSFALAHEYLHYIYLQTGQYERSLQEIAAADEINGAFTHEKSRNGNRLTEYKAVFEAKGIHGYFDSRYSGTPTAPESYYLYAIRHAVAGEKEKALDYLEKSTEARQFLSAFVRANPIFHGLRDEPRYQKMLTKMGLA